MFGFLRSDSGLSGAPGSPSSSPFSSSSRLPSPANEYAHEHPEDEDGGALGWLQSQASSLAASSTSAFDSVRHKLLGGDLPEDDPSRAPPPPSGRLERAVVWCGGFMPTLSKKQRLAGFVILLLGSLFCFGSAIFMLPVMLMQPRRFLLLLSVGNIFSIASFAFLRGPQAHFQHMFAPERSIITTVYLGATLGTMYSMLVLHSAMLTTLLALLQLGAVGCYFWSYLPGGSTSLRFMGSLFAKTATSVGSAMV